KAQVMARKSRNTSTTGAVSGDRPLQIITERFGGQPMPKRLVAVDCQDGNIVTIAISKRLIGLDIDLFKLVQVWTISVCDLHFHLFTQIATGLAVQDDLDPHSFRFRS